ncbi:hypothetical protein TrLO_g3838 [Triparma laevis f. longispina]|uniref:JmjC domain-containing protein n=1 Tax=Triparma laevis f. longispina TaxID=1714387 RepID=A0A9W7F3R8_9STRA|nr:hypothetical protein TrLO_g3838 [Triparma laevis f. longispina]
MIVFLLTFICVMGYMMTALSRIELGPEKETAKTGHKKIAKEITAAALESSEESILKPPHLSTTHKLNVKEDVLSLKSEFVRKDTPHCPPTPPKDYPNEYPVLDILKNWSPDMPEARPDFIYNSLCYFDYTSPSDRASALAYREAEVPFVVRSIPDVDDTVLRWSDPFYMKKLLGNANYKVEESVNNHFMYWRSPQKGQGPVKERDGKEWTEPTKMIKMKFAEWLDKANQYLGAASESKHWYFRVSGCSPHGGGCPSPNTQELFDEIPIFKPKPSLFMVKPKSQRGIHCRFGMTGVIAENHFDGSRNFIALFMGERRYILSKPKNCKNMALLPREHPSGRHSEVDWSNPDLVTFPQFKKVTSTEVVLQAGDVLYLPTQWFHYIISLGTNYQCNTRSGKSDDFQQQIHSCGF